MGIVQRNSFWNTVIGYAGVMIGFVSAVVLLPRLLTPEEVGLTNVLRSSGVMLAQLAALGGPSIVLRFFPFFRTPDGRYNGIFTLTFAVSALGVLLCSALFILFRPAIEQYYSRESALFVKYCLLSIPIAAAIVFYTLFSSWLRSMMRVIASAMWIEIAMRLAIIAAVLAYAFGWISFSAFICLFALGFGVPALGLIGHCWRLGMLTLDFKVTPQMREYWRPALGYGMFCLFTGFGSTMVGNIDSMMLGSGVGLESVAVYGIAINFMSVLQMPYRALSNAAAPLVAQYWQERRMDAMDDLYKRFTLNIVIVSLLLFLLVWTNVDIVYGIMPPIYATGKWALLILYLGRFADALTGLNTAILSTSVRYRWDLWLAIVLIALTIAANLILIPVWGIEGAALSTTISLFVMNGIRVWVVRHHFGLQPFSSPVWKIVLLALCVWAVVEIVPEPGFWLFSLILRSAMVCALFVGPVYYLRLSKDFNALIDAVIEKLLSYGKR